MNTVCHMGAAVSWCSECCAWWPTPLQTAACSKFVPHSPPQGSVYNLPGHASARLLQWTYAVRHLAQQHVLMLRVLCAVAHSAVSRCVIGQV